MRMKRPAKVNIGLDLDAEALAIAIARTAISNEPAGGNGKNGEGRPTPATAIPAGSAGTGEERSRSTGPSDATRWIFAVRDGISTLEALASAPRSLLCALTGPKGAPNGPVLVYCDPPYLMSTRRSGKLYKHEFTDAQHRQLLRVIRKLPCMVMVSGYWSKEYAEALDGWSAIQYQAMTRGGRMATEWVWFNFPAPVALHDYRYLGQNFRERERIKRKKNRWTARLQKMPTLERQALLYAVNAVLGDFGSEIARSGDASADLATLEPRRA